jgi:hypothetical protein
LRLPVTSNHQAKGEKPCHVACHSFAPFDRHRFCLASAIHLRAPGRAGAAGLAGARGGNSVDFTLRNTLPVTLSVTRAGSGSGAVSSQPPGIACGADCQASYAYATVVTLTAAAHTGSIFAGWSGACSGRGTCSLTMTAPEHVTATFVVGYNVYLPLLRRDGGGQ